MARWASAAAEVLLEPGGQHNRRPGKLPAMPFAPSRDRRRSRPDPDGGASQISPAGYRGVVIDMTVEAANARLSVIEETWQRAPEPERMRDLEELAEISRDLDRLTAERAANAEWLTRRLNRVVRHIKQDIDQR